MVVIPDELIASLPEGGIFSTGIEGSDPVVDGERRDQFREACDFYGTYEERLDRIAALGIRWLRFGPPYSTVHLGPAHYDLSFCDRVVAACRARGITVIADLLHFGLPDWLHSDSPSTPYFQNEQFPLRFAAFAAAFASQYPDIRWFTPVNEPFIAASFSAKRGFWNEQIVRPWYDDEAFVRAAANVARANILSRREIQEVWKEEGRGGRPMYVQSESFEVAFALPGSGREAEAERFNLRRFAALDLLLGHHDPAMRSYLLAQGISEQDYEWFMQHGNAEGVLLGIDHYPDCVHHLGREDDPAVLGRKQGIPFLAELVRTYWQRYRVPMIHSEVNARPGDAEALLIETYETVSRLRLEGIPVLGMGWYGDELQIGWQSAMRGPLGREEHPVGLYHHGRLQPVGVLFADLVKKGLPPLRIDMGSTPAGS